MQKEREREGEGERERIQLSFNSLKEGKKSFSLETRRNNDRKSNLEFVYNRKDAGRRLCHGVGLVTEIIRAINCNGSRVECLD
jgi:hypothetical protein